MTKSSMSGAVLALAAALVLNVPDAGAVPPDLDCDSCVGSKELADGAVTTPKIADQAVTTGKIAPGSVTGSELATGAVGPEQLQDGAVGAAKLQDASVGTATIQDSAVTSAKIAPGAVTADKLDPGIDLGGIELLRTIVVSPVGPTAADNCRELRNALAGIPDDNGPENAYLIKIEPGIYNCGTDIVEIKPYVNVEGAGANVTQIVSEASTSVVVRSNSGLRQLSVKYVGSNEYGAVAIEASTPSRIGDVDVLLENSVDGTSFGPTVGIFVSLEFEQVILQDVRIIGSVGGQIGVQVEPVFGIAGEVVAENMLIRADGAFGISNGARATIRNSVIDGSADADDLSEMGIIATQVTGEVFGSAVRCVGAYDAQFEPLDGACQPLGAPAP